MYKSSLTIIVLYISNIYLCILYRKKILDYSGIKIHLDNNNLIPMSLYALYLDWWNLYGSKIGRSVVSGRGYSEATVRAERQI